MSYISKKGRGMMGLGDSTPTCRTGPAFFQGGNWWVPIKDSDGKTYNLMQTNELAALPLCSSGSSSSGGGLTDLFGKLISGVTDVVKAKVTPAPVTNITTTGGGGGMSTTTKIAIAGVAVVGGVVLIRSLKKR